MQYNCLTSHLTGNRLKITHENNARGKKKDTANDTEL